MWGTPCGLQVCTRFLVGAPLSVRTGPILMRHSAGHLRIDCLPYCRTSPPPPSGSQPTQRRYGGMWAGQAKVHDRGTVACPLNGGQNAPHGIRDFQTADWTERQRLRVPHRAVTQELRRSVSNPPTNSRKPQRDSTPPLYPVIVVLRPWPPADLRIPAQPVGIATVRLNALDVAAAE